MSSQIKHMFKRILLTARFHNFSLFTDQNVFKFCCFHTVVYLVYFVSEIFFLVTLYLFEISDSFLLQLFIPITC